MSIIQATTEAPAAYQDNLSRKKKIFFSCVCPLVNSLIFFSRGECEYIRNVCRYIPLEKIDGSCQWAKRIFMSIFDVRAFRIYTYIQYGRTHAAGKLKLQIYLCLLMAK